MKKLALPYALSCLALSACGDPGNQVAPEATDTATPMPVDEAVAEEPVAELPPAPVSTAPDCASEEARDTLAKIAITNPNNKLDFIIQRNHPAPQDGESFGAVMSRNMERWKLIRPTAVYSLENVRTTAKDETLQNATCAADFKMEIENFGWARVPIVYKLETTSEGRLYATVNGIKPN